MPATPAKLSCSQCRDRKVKCDKEFPCTACQHAGISCTAIQRARLPRGRAANSRKKNEKLQSRLQQLESLIEQLESQLTPDNLRRPSPVEATTPKSDKLGSLIARDFWTELSSEVAGLREIIEEPSDDEVDTSSSQYESPSPVWDTASNAMFVGQGLSPKISPESPPEPIRKALLSVYRERVDMLFKVVHWPTAKAVIANIHTHDDTSDDHAAGNLLPARALEAAMLFLAVCAMDATECSALFQTDYQVIIHQLRLATEVHISRAKFLHHPDLIVLQAFVIYLLGLRVCMESALSWTLVALAWRIATALRLESTENRTKIEVETCRRLTFCIGVLDSQAAFDRGFAPMIPLEAFSNPAEITNDLQLTSQPTVHAIDSDPFTDMSFMYLLQEATICLRKLIVPAKNTSKEDPWADWKYKIRTIQVFEQSMSRHRAYISPSPKSIARFTEFSTQHISLNLHLGLRRPPYRLKDSPVPPWDDFDLLQATTAAMERIITKIADPVFKPFQWFSRSWVEWNALAVLLAELCTPRQDALANRAWNVAQFVFNQYAEEMSTTTDAQQLWKPVAKLFRRVQKIRVPSSGYEASAEPAAGMRKGSAPKPSKIGLAHSEPIPGARLGSDPSIDSQMSDLSFQFPPSATVNAVQASTSLGPWFAGVDDWQYQPDLNMQAPEEFAWYSWDNFLGDLQTAPGPADLYGPNPA